MLGAITNAMGLEASFKPHIFMLDESYIPFIFTVPPTDFRVTSQQSHAPVDIIDFGEKVLDGTRGCVRVSWSGMFLHPRHGWIPNGEDILNFLPPKTCEMNLRNYMNNNEKFKLFVPEWLEYIKCKIESFEITYRDHTGDIYYNISLVEEREGLSNTSQLIAKVDNFIDDTISTVTDSVKGMLPPALSEVQLRELYGDNFEVYINDGKEIITNGVKKVSGAVTDTATSVSSWTRGTVNDLLDRPGSIPKDTKSRLV